MINKHNIIKLNRYFPALIRFTYIFAVSRETSIPQPFDKCSVVKPNNKYNILSRFRIPIEKLTPPIASK